jgi:hypothetical protein
LTLERRCRAAFRSVPRRRRLAAGRSRGLRVGGTPTPNVIARGYARAADARNIGRSQPSRRHAMVTKLEGQLRREIAIDGSPYVVTLTPSGLTLTEKGRRKGFAMDWSAFVNGDVALATALSASLAAAPAPRPRDARNAADAAAPPRGTRRSPAG